jgi:hypothetical protein
MHIICQIQESEITGILFLVEATRERDLLKSLKLLPSNRTLQVEGGKEMKDYFTVNELADHFGANPKTIYDSHEQR